MKRGIFFFNLLVVILLFGCDKDHTSIKGVWVGTAAVSPFPEFVKLEYDSIPNVQLFYSQIEQNTIIDFDGKTVSFPIDQSNQLGYFEGELQGDTIKGKFLLDERHSYPCNLVRVQRTSLEEVGQLVGYYELEPNHAIEVLPFPMSETLTGLAILDYTTGKWRVAFPKGQGYFGAGPKLLTPYPEELSFKMVGENSNKVPGIEFTDNGKTFKAVRMPDLTHYEDFEVQNGDVTISCTISYPTSGKDFPLIIHTPGAGPITRAEVFDYYLKMLPHKGVAVLTYDKRGSGNSTGNLQNATYDDLASDLEAIIAHVRNKKELDINPDNIGISGYDQASLVMPIVLAKDNKLKFMLSLAGTALSVEAQEYLACQFRMESDGFDAVQVNLALNYLKDMFKYLRGELPESDFKAHSDKIKDTPIAKYVTLFDNKEYMQQWSVRHDFDPVNYLNQVKVPMLFAYADNDLIAPPKYNYPVIKKVFEKVNNPQNQLIVYSDANHLFMLWGNKRRFTTNRSSRLCTWAFQQMP